MGGDVIQLQLVVDHSQIALQQRDGNAVSHRVVQGEMTVPVRIVSRARKRGRDVERPGERVR